MRPACSALLVLSAIAACDRPEVLLICHNSNCAEPVDPENDDTLEAMRESLALQYNGKPAIDGAEIDSFWRGSDDTCLFAHDLEGARTTPAIDAANELAAYFTGPTPQLTYSGKPFRVMIELKSHTAVDTGVHHTPAQRELHADCAWQLYGALATGALAGNREVEVYFEAFAPELLETMMKRMPALTPIPFHYAAIQGIPAPLDDQTRQLTEYKHVPIELVEIHDQWITDGQLELIHSMKADLALWMFSATVETFAAIEQYEPASVVSSEAELVRRWLER